MKEPRYGLIWNGEEHEGLLLAGAVEVAAEYMRGKGYSLKIEHDTLEYWGDPETKRKKGKLAYFLKGPNDNDTEWEFIAYIRDRGSEEANLSEACADWVKTLAIINGDLEDDCAILPIETPEQEAAFTLPLDALLDRITLLEYLKSEIDTDYEPGVRVWYYMNKGNAKQKKAA